MVVGLYGRARAVELVREWLPRPAGNIEEDRGRRPVLLFEGGPGSGKTAVLDSLARQLSGQAPYAHIDLKTVGNQLDASAIPQLLAALAFQLAGHCERYGTLRFPRLVLGHLVMGLQLDWVDRDVARRQVDQALREHRGVEAVTAVLQDAAQGALAAVPQIDRVAASLIRRLIKYTVDKITSSPLFRRPILGPYQEWYGHQDRRLNTRPIETLINLNRWAKQSDNKNHRGQVNSLLLSAFLADLRDNFKNGRHCDEWPFNCVVLIDNADTVLGRMFLAELVQVRGLRYHDPLTVVATSDGGPAAGLADDASPFEIHDANQRLADDAGPPAWLRYQLRDLTAEEVRSMVRTLDFTETNVELVAAELYQFTRGHPAATRLLLDAISAHPGNGPENGAELEAVLGSRRSGGTVEDELRRRLLGGVRAEVVEHLVTFSAARHRADGELLTTRQDLGLNRVENLPEGLWLPTPGTEPTVLRRLLLRRLAARDAKHPANWTTIHKWLQGRSDRRGDLEGKLYYALTDGALNNVARTLTGQLNDLPVPDWLRLVRAVCEAPRRDTESVGSESAARGLLVGVDPAEQPFASVIAVVARLWIAADPLGGSDRTELYWQLAGAFGALAGPNRVNDDSGELFNATHQYERLSKWYEHRTQR